MTAGWRRLSPSRRRRNDLLPRMRSVVPLRRCRLRQHRQLVLVPRRTDNMQTRRGGAFHASDTPQARLLTSLVTSRAHLLHDCDVVGWIR